MGKSARIQGIRRKLQLGIRPAVIDASTGSPYVPGKPGYVYVRYRTADGFSQPLVVKLATIVSLRDGIGVFVGYDKTGQLAVVAPDTDTQIAQGYSPLLNNPADSVINSFVDLSRVSQLMTFPYPGTPLSIGVGQWMYQRDGTAHNFEGVDGGVDVTSYIPAAAGEHCLILLSLKTDDTIEITQSTDQSVLDGLDLTDVQECLDSKTLSARPIDFWRLYNGMTELVNGDRYLDFRHFINVSDHADSVVLDHLSGASYTTLQDLQTVYHSAGWISGGTITDAGGGNINIAAGQGAIRLTDNMLGSLNFFDWPALAAQAVPANAVRFIGVEYNAGTPQVVLHTTYDWNHHDDFPLGVAVYENSVMHIQFDPMGIGDHASLMAHQMFQVMPNARDERGGGLILDESGDGNRDVLMSAGTLWSHLNQYAIAAFDTSGADTFDIYYRDGAGGFTLVAGLGQWPNTQYDDGSGTLADLTNNRYGNLWFWVELDGDISAMYGRGNHANLADARAETFPDTIPVRIENTGRPLGRILFQKSATTAEQVDTVFAGTLSTSTSLFALTVAEADGTPTVTNVKTIVVSNGTLTDNGSGQVTVATGGGTSPWTTDTNVVNLNTDTDSVTIGSNTAGGKLFVDGDADEVQLQIQGNATQNAALAVFEDSAGADQVTIGNTGAVVINEQGNDADSRIEGDNDANLIYTDASTDQVGIGTAAPGAKLDVRGSVVINEDSADVDVRIESNGDANNLFSDGGNDNVGMGTGTPAASAKLDITSTTKGLLSPRMTQAQRIAISSPATGLELFNTSVARKQVYNGAFWETEKGLRIVSRNGFSFRANGDVATIYGIGGTDLSQVGAGSWAAARDADGPWVQHTTQNATGNIQGWDTAYTVLRTGWGSEIIWEARIKSPAAITNKRLWIGLSSAAFTNSDTAPGHCAAFRYSTPAADAGWMGVTRDGTTQSVTAAQVANIAANTEYLLRIRIDTVNDVVYFSVNDSAESSLSANLPSETQDLGITFTIILTALGATTWLFGESDCYWDM